jgi:hypothetical protein
MNPEFASRGDDSTRQRERGRSDAEKIADLVVERYRVGRSSDGQPFAVRRDGPNIALPLRGPEIRATLARDFRARYRRTPSAGALADAITCIEGLSLDSKREPVHLRVAEHDGSIVLDLGDESGAAVIVGPDGWHVEERSPVLFRRSALTATLPRPERGGDIDELRRLLNVRDDDWPLLVGWLVAALFRGVAHPILLIGGFQGAGKTTAASLIASLVDPSAVESSSPPKDPEAWVMLANGSWVVFSDNISGIPTWWADALCRTVTGAGWVRRALYTDAELSVIAFRRCVILTSIDPGALRGDLGDRILLLNLEPIDDGNRRPESELRRRYEEIRPRALGGLLDLVAQVLRSLPGVRPDSLPRMADFGRILFALDSIRGTRAFDRYIEQRTSISEIVVESDQVAEALKRLLAREHGSWYGTAGDLLRDLQSVAPEHRYGWPPTPRGLAGRLRRLAPALQSVGVLVTFPEPEDKTRRYTLSLVGPAGDPGDSPGGTGSNRPEETPSGAAENGVFRAVGRFGRLFPKLSGGPGGDGFWSDGTPLPDGPPPGLDGGGWSEEPI